MREPIFTPGLQIYIFELIGKFTYSFSRNGKEPIPVEYAGTDFGPSDPEVKDDETDRKGAIDVIVNGFHLQLVKNERNCLLSIWDRKA